VDLILGRDRNPIPHFVHKAAKKNHCGIILSEIMIKGKERRHTVLNNTIKSLLRGAAHKPIPISRRITDIVKVKVIRHDHQGRSSQLSVQNI
jgi:hypothetical protein